MKKLWIVGLISISFVGCTSKYVAKNSIPPKVVTSFHEEYPNAENVKWRRNKGFYDAAFSDAKGRNNDAYYKADGTEVTDPIVHFK